MLRPITVLLALLVLPLLACPGELQVDCESDADCGGDLTCIGGACIADDDPPQCVIDTDCPGTQVCQMGACVTSLPTGDGDGDADVSLDPADGLDFGAPALGVGIEKVLSVHNDGPGSFSLLSAGLSAETSDEFVVSMDAPPPVVIPANGSVDITVTYTLADGTEDQGTLVLSTNATGCGEGCQDPSLIEVPLSSGFDGTANLSVTPAAYSFGYAEVGSTTPETTMLITNTGSLDKILTVFTVTPAGDINEFEYTVPDLPLYLAPGESHAVPVAYAPVSIAASHTLTFAINANSDSPGLETVGVVFDGTSEAPNALVWEPVELAFPELNVGQGAQLTAQLVNSGTVAVNVDDLVLGAQSPVEYAFTALANGVTVTFPRLLFGGDALDVVVDFTSVSGLPSQTTITALNDQASGVDPVLTLRGESYMPVGGTILEAVVGPQDAPDPDCLCQANTGIPAADVSIQYRNVASGQVCSRPPSQACGLEGTNCECTAMNIYGEVFWGGAWVEDVRDQTWIIDEAVRHSGEGQDGTFEVAASLLDDCLSMPGSTDYSTNYNCCLVDCGEFGGGGAWACYDFSPSPICTSECQLKASVATSQDCMQRGPNRLKATVTIKNADNSIYEERAFCRTFQQSGDAASFVQIVRQAGVFTFGAVDPGVTEIDPAAACP